MTETQIYYKQNGVNVIGQTGNTKNDNENMKNFIIRLGIKGIIDIKNLKESLDEYLSEKIVNGIDKSCEEIVKRM